MITGDVTKWLTLGTGVGIEIRGGDLQVTIAKMRLREIRVVASITIHDFRNRAALDWGSEYEAFLKEHASAHLTATVLLPRDEVIVRQLPVPGVKAKDLEAAIRYQIDSLHPYPEDTVTFGWARLPAEPLLLIGIAQRDVVDQYAALFAEAGIRAASFTFSPAVVYSVVRMAAAPPSEGFLVVEPLDEEWEAYGESESRPLFSATFDLPPERVVALAAAELRLDPEVEPVRLVELLPSPSQVPGEWNLSEHLLSYATALVGACPWLALSANLLPREQRSRSSRTIYAPTVALAAMLLIMLVVLGAYGSVKDSSYRSAIESEIAKYADDAARVQELDTRIEELRARRELLRRFRNRTHHDLNALLGLTVALPPPAWIRTLDITRTQIDISGEAPEADRLLELIDESPLFKNSEYTSQISGSGALQSFSIRSVREFGEPGGGE